VGTPQRQRRRVKSAGTNPKVYPKTIILRDKSLLWERHSCRDREPTKSRQECRSHKTLTWFQDRLQADVHTIATSQNPRKISGKPSEFRKNFLVGAVFNRDISPPEHISM
jgi:hypothetical protein